MTPGYSLVSRPIFQNPLYDAPRYEIGRFMPANRAQRHRMQAARRYSMA
jgi:hypothetical protein